jgi:hypothetical protein
MQPIPVNFLGILRLLNGSGARFVVIGGVALLLHGGDNFTLSKVCYVFKVKSSNHCTAGS